VRALVAMTLQGAEVGDTTSLLAISLTAAEQLAAVQATVPTALVGDRGYHSNDALLTLRRLGIRAYLAEPDRGRRCWAKEPEAQQPVYDNRRRIGGPRGKRLTLRHCPHRAPAPTCFPPQRGLTSASRVAS